LMLNTEFVPGSNTSGDMACADWRFLLPSLDLEEVLCLRMPPIKVVSVLSTICRRLNVVSTDLKAIEELNRAARERGLSKLRVIHANDYARLPFSESSMDLIWIAGVDGSLETRMTNSPAQNNLRAKTGTIGGVSSLSGYVRTADGEMLAFSIMMQNFIGSSEPYRKAQDAIGIMMANLRRR